jgi:hypothetical protein
MLITINKFVKDESGSVIVILAVACTVLLGFVALGVDVGLLYFEQGKLSRAADAAVLAGAQELPDTTKARNTAIDYAQRNGLTISSSEINFSDSNRQISVSVNKTVYMHFAKALGREKSTVNSSSAARISGVSGVSKLIPLGINESLLPLNAGTEYLIKGGAQDGNPWRGIIEYPGQGNGGSAFRELVINGYDGTVRIGDILGQVPGNKSGPTMQGVDTRVGSCSDGCTWNNYQAGCPRVVLVPIYHVSDDDLVVTGFASVFLNAAEGNGVDSRVTATFIINSISGETDDSITNSYLNSVKLVH